MNNPFKPPRPTMRIPGWMSVSLAAVVFLSATPRADAQNTPTRVLVVTATHGFRHTEAIEASRKVLSDPKLANEFRFDFIDEASALTPARLAQYDVLFLDNSTLRIVDPNDPKSVVRPWPNVTVTDPVTREQQDAIAAFVRGGKGLVVVHAGIDALYGWDEYREMVGGGLFQKHPYTREARVTVEDQKNAAMSPFGPSVSFREEYYYLDKNPRPVSHVLMSLDLTSVNDTTKTDHPLAFVKRYGQGRVFVNLLGHFGTTWQRPDYQRSLLEGIRIAAGRIPADFTISEP